MPKRNLISQAAYARHRGVSRQSVMKAVRDGRIPTVKGKIDPVEADAAWTANTDPSTPSNTISGNPGGAARRRRGKPPSIPEGPAPRAGRGRARAKASDAGDAPGSEDDPPGSSTQNGAGNYAAYRAIREGWNAKLARLEYEQKAGKLVPVADVHLAAFNVGRQVRDQLMALPARLAPKLFGTKTQRECQELLRKELRRICDSMVRP